ncbi:MAG TPA: hypothetical protein VLM41_08920, partial [Steroidobacteraceae bacterium]|nr:hypothetical protein [Steroidobacteraceae bacterium]
MNTTGVDSSKIPELLRPRLANHLAALAQRDGAAASLELPSRLADSLPRVWACSDFVAEACLRDEALLEWLGSTAGRLHGSADRQWLAAGLEDLIGGNDDDAHYLAALRRFRRRQLARIAWRDLASFADVDEILLELTLLADVCIDSVFRRANLQLSARHGAP